MDHGRPLGMHGVDHAHVIDVRGHLRKEIRDPSACFTVLLEGPGRLHDAMSRRTLASLGKHTVICKREHLAIALRQQRLVVE